MTRHVPGACFRHPQIAFDGGPVDQASHEKYCAILGRGRVNSGAVARERTCGGSEVQTTLRPRVRRFGEAARWWSLRGTPVLKLGVGSLPHFGGFRARGVVGALQGAQGVIYRGSRRGRLGLRRVPGLFSLPLLRGDPRSSSHAIGGGYGRRWRAIGRGDVARRGRERRRGLLLLLGLEKERHGRQRGLGAGRKVVRPAMDRLSGHPDAGRAE